MAKKKQTPAESAESAAQTAQETAGSAESAAQTAAEKNKRVRMLTVVCRPEGTFLDGKVYEIDGALARTLVSAGLAREETE